MRRVLENGRLAVCVIVIGIGILAACMGAVTRFGKGAVESRCYQLFAIDQTVSWRQNESGFFRVGSMKNFDNILLTKDPWKHYDISFRLINLRTCGVITHFKDKEHFYFISFEPTRDLLFWGKRTGEKSEILKPVSMALRHDENLCRVIVTKGRGRFFVNGQKIFDLKIDGRPGFFGFLLDSAAVPVMGFTDIHVRGVLEDGMPMEAEAPLVKGFSFSWRIMAAFLMILAVSLFWGALCLWAARVFSHAVLAKAGAPDEKRWLSPLVVFLLHTAAAALIFWPFFRRGEVLIASYDNIGEIFPLFFYSKHVFLDWLKGASPGLWNPLAHNGVPFYTSHWNMAFYPLHWPIFFAPDRQVLFWLTFKTFLETVLIGILAYGFFFRELGSRIWAAVCSLSYQLGSLLIFSMTIFPAVSLFFSMTLYLYLIWSFQERKPVLNYLWITLAVYLMLTSANVAFVFYAGISILILTLYRFWSSSLYDRKAFVTVLAAGLTGILIASIRILPCLWGVMNSNRLVSDYFSIHDRFPLILRLFVPEIAGWLGPENFSVFDSAHLGWVFDNINPQSGFFVYFGIVIGWLVVLSLVVRGDKKLLFWKLYGWTLLLMALLWKPVWGVLSILFFPLNHYSYHMIMLPAALCGLGGHVGLALTRQDGVSHQGLRRAFLIALAGFFSYGVVFMTYLFPAVTPLSRLLLLFFMVLGVLWLAVKRYWPQYFGRVCDVFFFLWFVLSWSVLFVLDVVYVFTDIPMKFGMDEAVFWPYLFILNFLGLVVYWARRFYQNGKIRAGIMWLAGWAAGVLGSFFIFGLYLDPFLKLDAGLRLYLTDVCFGIMKWLTLTFLLTGGYVLMKKTSRPAVLWGMGLLVLVVADLLVFNARFDNIAAPFFHQKAFYSRTFEYADVHRDLKEKMDIKDYRVGHQERAGLNANKNFIFGLPSYSGTIGYMPKRFAEFIHAFGVPEDAILIYPSDAIKNDRFLDLSCVRYLFRDEDTFRERESALPKMAVFYNYSVVSDKDLVLKVLNDERFDYHQEVLLSKPVRLGSSRPIPLPYDPVPIRASNSDEVRADVTVKYPGVLVFNESFDEGWRAYVDGQETMVVPANHNFMACPVDPGTHKIRFLYRPRKFFVAKAVHYAGLLIFIVVGGLGLYYNYRHKGPT